LFQNSIRIKEQEKYILYEKWIMYYFIYDKNSLKNISIIEHPYKYVFKIYLRYVILNDINIYDAVTLMLI